jgi:uncharacterized protein YbjT (DUF2867 family)
MDRLAGMSFDGAMTTTSRSTPTRFAVIGGAGKTGRRVAERLSAAGHEIRLASRSTTPAFHWDDPTTWPEAIEGVDAAYVAFAPDLTVPGTDRVLAASGAAARAHGVQRLVLLSGRGEPAAKAAEEALAAAGVETTVVRCSFFAQNFSEHFLLHAVLDGIIALPAGDVAEPIVDADDIADVAVAALTGTIPTGGVYELTGPRLMTFHDVADDLSAATRRRVVYIDVTTEDYVEAASAAGVPADEAEMLADLFTHIFDGHNATLATGVAEALGRPARDFRDYAAVTAATGVWDVAGPADRPVA